MAADDLYADLIPPPLDADALGVSPLRPAPMAPAPSPGESPVDKILKLVAAGIALKLGPGSGTGLLQGMNQATAQKAQQRRYDEQTAQQQYRFERQQYAQEEARQARDLEQRQRTVQSTVESLRKIAPTLKTKAEYDRYVDAYGQGLRNLGYRIDGNYFRSAVPYSAPTVEKEAQDLLDRWMKNPVNANLLKESPEEALKASVLFDRDGDGVPEAVSLPDLASLARMPFAQDGAGELIFSPAGTSKEDKANEEGIYNDLIQIARSEGKLVDGKSPEAVKRRLALKEEARRRAGDASRKAETAGQPGSLPPNVQRRLDAKTKAFDAQPTVKRAQLVAEAVTFVNGLSNTTTNPADDIGLLYAFAKANDPDSVVREGEYATVQKYAQSWAESFGFEVARIFSNKPFLTPAARANMKATIQAKYRATKVGYDTLRKSYAEQIDRITNQPGTGADYLIDYGSGFPSDEPAASPPPTPSYQDYLKQHGGKP